MTGVLMKTGNLDIDTHTGKTSCEDAGRGQSDAKEQGKESKDCQQTTRSYKRSIEQIPLTALKKNPPCQHLDLGLGNCCWGD